MVSLKRISGKQKYFKQALDAIQQKEIQLRQIDYSKLTEAYQKVSVASLIDSVIALEYSIVIPIQESIGKYKRFRQKAIGKNSFDWRWLD